MVAAKSYEKYKFRPHEAFAFIKKLGFEYDWLLFSATKSISWRFFQKYFSNSNIFHTYFMELITFSHDIQQHHISWVVVK